MHASVTLDIYSTIQRGQTNIGTNIASSFFIDFKMADATKKVIVSETSHSDDDLPPPPPPPVPPRPLDYEGSPPLASLPVPPPKETFSTFYQQQQKNEIKRLFKHIHPELRDNLNDMVDDELVEALHSDAAEAADAGYQAEVQSMRWIFENWTLDNIGDPHDQEAARRRRTQGWRRQRHLFCVPASGRHPTRRLCQKADLCTRGC